MLGKEEWGVPGNSGYCILMLGTKMKEERSKILWNNITNCWNLQEAVTFIEYRRRMPAVSPMCLKSRGTEPWQSKKKNHPYLILDAWQISQPLLVKSILCVVKFPVLFLGNLPEYCQFLSKSPFPRRSGRATWFLSWVWGYKFSTGLRCPLALVEKASDHLRRRLWRCLYLVVRDGEQPVAGRKNCGVKQRRFSRNMRRVWRHAVLPFSHVVQGLVTVPFWEYWTSPYSSHYRPYT